MRVRNEGKNSRWYSGSGIYRHVVADRHRRRARAPLGLVRDDARGRRSEQPTVQRGVELANAGARGDEPSRCGSQLLGPDRQRPCRPAKPSGCAARAAPA